MELTILGMLLILAVAVAVAAISLWLIAVNLKVIQEVLRSERKRHIDAPTHGGITGIKQAIDYLADEAQYMNLPNLSKRLRKIVEDFDDLIK